MAGQLFIISEVDVERTSAFQGGIDAGKAIESVKSVRRPHMGYQIKEDTYATMSVVSAGGESGPRLANSSQAEKNSGNFTSNFILQSVSEQRSEKFQPITTFGATYGFFFGEQPRMMSFQAVLLNSADFQWEAEWWDNYDKVTRGTRLTDRQSRVYLQYDEVIIEGYLVGAATQKSSSAPFEVPLSFTMWVTNIEYLTPGGVGSVVFPASPDAAAATPDGLAVDYGKMATAGGAYVSTTDQVRAANVAALRTKDIGYLATLRKNLTSAEGHVDAQITAARNFLYGRNLVIPAGFVTDGPTGRAPQTVRLPAAFYPKESPPRTRFYDNIDEDPVRGDEGVKDRSALVFNNASAMQDINKLAAESAAAAEDGERRLSAQSLPQDAIRLLSTAAFAVVSVGLSLAQADKQSTSVLTAAQEQARAEALTGLRMSPVHHRPG
jgi:hypothetical protein